MLATIGGVHSMRRRESDRAKTVKERQAVNSRLFMDKPSNGNE